VIRRTSDWRFNNEDMGGIIRGLIVGGVVVMSSARSMGIRSYSQLLSEILRPKEAWECLSWACEGYIRTRRPGGGTYTGRSYR
jgi:hypothetical protein